MAPEVSVIIPCYNQQNYIGEALNSVLAQTFTNWECIVVNDGSTDNTKEVVSEFIKGDARFQYFEKQNEGPSIARNYGISCSSCEYILPLDGDDKFSPNYIAECIEVLKNYPSVKVVYGGGDKFGVRNEPWALQKFSIDKLLFFNMIHCSAMYRKKDWESIGGYDANMTYGYEDWEFWISLIKNDDEVVFLDNIKFYWRIKEESRTTKISLWKDAKMKQYIYTKHAALYDEYFIDPLKLFKEKEALETTLHGIMQSPFKFFCSRLLKRRKRISNNK